MNTLVSIIMPAYNASEYLSNAVQSVVRQSYTDWELLIVDDCSKDNTYDAALRLANSDSRIKVKKNKVNSGPAVTRNTALECATGSYIAFLDSDDIWFSEKLEKQLSFMQKNSIKFSYTQYRRIDTKNTKEGELAKIPVTLSYTGLLKNTAIATSTVVIDRAAVGDFRMTETYYDDFVLWLEIIKRGFAAYGLKEDLMRYRVTSGSVSRNKLRSSLMVWKTYREIEKLGLLHSVWCFMHYAIRGFLKYRKF